jgi:pyruvate,water dikinase
MATAGFAVPDGFLVTTAAYRQFVSENGLQSRILELARPELKDGTATFKKGSESIRQMFAGAELSEELVAEITEAYAALSDDDPALAVRSSANAEDLPDLSFAGQQETYLNVRGADAVVAAVKDCWSSLWTVQAITYRHQNGIDQGSVAMAVVAQIMVPSEVSGVLFTANPATGERSELIVEASFGLGEAVVGGHVTPDSYVVDRQTLSAKETMIGLKEQQIVYDGEHGTRTEEVAEDERQRSSLSEDRLKELSATAIEIEALYDGVPQDIEWALEDGKLWMLQSRPITNLPPQPIEVVWEPEPPAKILYRRQIVENLPGPVCPLFDELYLTEGLEASRGGKSLMAGGGPLFVTLHGFAYQRADWPQFADRELKKNPTEEEVEAAERAAREYIQKLVKHDPEMEEHDLSLFLSSLDAEDRKAFDEWVSTAGIDDLAHQVTMPESDNPTYVAFNKTQVNEDVLKKWREETLPRLLETIEGWKEVDPGAASDDELLRGIRELSIAEGDYWSNDTSHTFGVAKSTDDQLQCFMRETLPDHHFTSGQFLSGFKSRTMEATEAMYGISKQIQASESLYELVMTTPAQRLMEELESHPDSGAVLDAIDEYLATYGHQGYTLDFVEPPQIEDPTGFFATLKTMVANRDYSPKQHAVEAARKREKALADVEELLEGLHYWQFRYRHWFTHRFYYIREECMFYLGSAWPTLRRLVAELGQRLVETGTFTLPENVYYCTTAELSEAIDARRKGKALPEIGQRATERRELREARKRLHPPGTVPPEASQIFEIRFKETQAVNDPSSDTLRGVPVSPGTVTGPVSVIRSPAEFDQMKPGSILVCTMTNPAWTPLFAHAIGLVTDIGGILGHGSIVAREYGIPAVVGTGNVTQRLKSGQEVRVDGDAGIVTILSP